jgi:glutathione S-transferase
MTPLLYSFRRCPYAMRARMAIAASGQKVRLREIILRDKPAHMLELSPKGTVPVLQLADGTIIDESREVMDWALGHGDPLGWLAHKDAALIDLFDGDFKHHLDRYKYATRYEDEEGGADARAHRDACFEILSQLNEKLQADWLAGAAPGYTDVAILPFIRQFRIADMDWFDKQMGLARVQAYVVRFLDWPGFVTIMQKYTLWLDSEAEHEFPILASTD